MELKKITFTENEGALQEWSLDSLLLGSRNLIVGRNTSGKSRTLSVIASLARNLANLQPPGMSAKYTCFLEHEDKKYIYELNYYNQQVISEKLVIDDIVRLERGEGGVGKIFAEGIDGGTNIKFQAPIVELAAVVRRDTVQHSFLEPLYEWASSLRYYQFGTTLGKDQIVILNPGSPKVDERNQQAVVGIFRDGITEFPNIFHDAILRDMADIEYHIEKIDISTPVSIRVAGLPGEPLGLSVKEKDLPGITDQFSMSQGMFRVLSLIIHVNYIQFKKSASCILIDDIGEGLDFDRSCRLIELLRSKAGEFELQIIMTTNDRFVMNKVPLEEWSVLQRTGNSVKVVNYSNSRKIFDDFKYTGLSNFSFFELDIPNDVIRQEDSNE